jgi:predicted RNase H-like HicB family nuclease
VVVEAVKSYRVTYERDESGWWVATVRGVRGCHTQGRTVDEARRRIREALGLFADDARRVSVVDEVKLPTAAARAILTYTNLRKRPTKRTGVPPERLDARSRCCEGVS